MSLVIGRTVDKWYFDADQTARVASAIVSMGKGCRLEIEPYLKDGEPQIRWRVVSDTATADGGDPPGGNDSHVCPGSPGC